MDINEIKKELKGHLLKGEERLFMEIDKVLIKKGNKFNQFLLLQAKYNDINNARITGILSQDLLFLRSNKLMFSILNFIDSLSFEDLKFENLKINIFKYQESFCKYKEWQQLLKVGDWSYNKENKSFIGEGMNKYLLSKNIYGESPLIINFKLAFLKSEEYKYDGVNNMNSGIILGWRKEDNLFKYYNILITGREILLEKVGFKTGNVFRDFKHLDNGFEFEIKDGQSNEFSIEVSKNVMDLFVDNRFKYSFVRPQPMIGRIGLRPWRGRLFCNYFEIIEN